MTQQVLSSRTSNCRMAMLSCDSTESFSNNANRNMTPATSAMTPGLACFVYRYGLDLRRRFTSLRCSGTDLAFVHEGRRLLHVEVHHESGSGDACTNNSQAPTAALLVLYGVFVAVRVFLGTGQSLNPAKPIRPELPLDVGLLWRAVLGQSECTVTCHSHM